MDLTNLINQVFQQCMVIGLFFIGKVNGMIISSIPNIGLDDIFVPIGKTHETNYTLKPQNSFNMTIDSKSGSVQRFEQKIILSNASTSIPLLKMDVPDGVKIMSESIVFQNNCVIISFTTFNTTELSSFPINIYFKSVVLPEPLGPAIMHVKG